MKKHVKSRNSRAKRHNKRQNTGKAAVIPAVVKAEGARGKGPSLANAEIPVAVKTSSTGAKPVAVAMAEIPVEAEASAKPARSKSSRRRGKRTSNVAVLPMAVARTAQSRAKRHIGWRTPRRPQRVVARREHKSVQNEPGAAPNLLGIVVSAAAAVQEAVVNTAAKLSLTIINGVESFVRKLFRFEKRAATKVSGVLGSIPRQAADTASRVVSGVDRLAPA